MVYTNLDVFLLYIFAVCFTLFGTSSWIKHKKEIKGYLIITIIFWAIFFWVLHLTN